VIYRKSFHSLEASYYQIPACNTHPGRNQSSISNFTHTPHPLLLMRSYTISLLEQRYLLATCLNVPFFFFGEVWTRCMYFKYPRPPPSRLPLYSAGCHRTEHHLGLAQFRCKFLKRIMMVCSGERIAEGHVKVGPGGNSTWRKAAYFT